MKAAIRFIPFLILLGIATLVLSGCLSTAGLTDVQKANMTSKAKLYALNADYVTALRALSPYLDQPFCSETVVLGCKDRAVVDRLQTLDREICGPPPVEGQAGCSADSALGIAAGAEGSAQIGAINAVRALLLRFSSEIAQLKVKT